MVRPIDEAISFLADRVLLPAINNPNAPDKVRNLTRNSLAWIKHFEHVGDLLKYMKRFEKANNAETYLALRELGLEAFEDIKDEFLDRFQAYQHDKFRLEDFVVGRTYSSHQILIPAETYDTRAGGILTAGAFGQHIAVLIKATLSGGQYANEWLDEGERLKYYLKSISGNFNEDYQDNRAISQYPHLPIYAFVRESENRPFKFAGVFHMLSINEEGDGAKWFELQRDMGKETDVGSRVSFEKYVSDLDKQIDASKGQSSQSRQKRLNSAPKKPNKVEVVTTTYQRNADVIAEVLERADGVCEQCGSDAPFLRRKDNTPYLEVHHTIPLAEGGDDTVENATALCPNCHREAHYG